MIQIKDTPNPHSLQFIFEKNITDKNLEFSHQQKAHSSPLAQMLLGFPWVQKVFISKNFITITKEDWVEWETLKSPLLHLISDYIESEKNIVIPTSEQKTSLSDEDSSSIVKKIKHIIDHDIQPAVEMDGGFIEFSSYKDGKIYLRLQGACAGCPSAEITLKQGIEARMQAEIPEIKEVISI